MNLRAVNVEYEPVYDAERNLARLIVTFETSDPNQTPYVAHAVPCGDLPAVEQAFDVARWVLLKTLGHKVPRPEGT